MRYLTGFMLLAAVALLTGCGTKPRAPQALLDSPQHHVRTGESLLLQGGDAVRAEAAFDTALELDPEYGPALAGKGVAQLLQAEHPAQQGTVDADDALDLVEDGLDEADTPAEELAAYVSLIRAYVILARMGEVDAEELLDETEDFLEEGVELKEDDDPSLDLAPLQYARGLACMQAEDLDCAEAMFAAVLRATPPNPEYAELAELKWRAAQQVRRAGPRTTAGAQAAMADAITRAEMAALLVEKLGVERFYGRTQAAAGSIYETPQTADRVETVALTDVAGHPLRHAVEIVAAYDVRGLRPFHGGRFAPDIPLSKAEAAMVLEDIIVRATGDDALATKFIGRESPFVDVRPDHPFFNAVMLATTRGLLASNARQGRFEPAAPLSGAEAALAVSALETELNVW